MQIAIVGTGYVGLVTGACLADLGYAVVCVDSDAEKVRLLKSGVSPIYEPGLDEVLENNLKAGRLSFTSDMAEAASKADVVFIAVGTPASENDGLPDLTHFNAAVAQMARVIKRGALVVVKSTVPVGTTRKLASQLSFFRPDDGLEAASNPEFLRQGSAVKDFMQPDRVVVGVGSDRAQALLARLYEPLAHAGVPILATTYESSELIKYASNTLLAAKVAFINEMADLCEKLDANVRDVARGVGLDKRIGDKFLQPGPGFGGSCFPKDTLALLGIARTLDLKAPLVNAVIDSNELHKRRMLEKIEAACGGNVSGQTIAVLGLTFKAGTDDLRESVSLLLVPGLIDKGARIRAYDPQGMAEAKKRFEGGITWCNDTYDAITGADCTVIITEWNEFKTIDLGRARTLMRKPLMVDLRNLYKRRDMMAAGLRYVSVGRAEVSPDKAEVKDLLPIRAEAI